jgi:hypothetical protein
VLDILTVVFTKCVLWLSVKMTMYSQLLMLRTVG